MYGRYIPYADPVHGLEHIYTFQFLIPYTNFLKYQAFGLYPNTIVGELTELHETSTDAFVWASVPISASLEEDKFLHGESSSCSAGDPDLLYTIQNDSLRFTCKFTQTGCEARVLTPLWDATDSNAGESKCYFVINHVRKDPHSIIGSPKLDEPEDTLSVLPKSSFPK